MATVAAVDAAVLAEQPYLRIIHGMGTGVVRERVRRVVSGDRRVGALRLRAAQPGRHRRHDRGVLGVSMIPDEIVEQVRDSADLVGHHRRGGRAQAHRLGLPRALSVPRRHPPQLRRHPQEGPLLLLRLPRERRRLLVAHEAARHGLSRPRCARSRGGSGITIPERAARAGPDPLEPLFGAVAVAQDWFTRQLLEAAEAKGAREYLEGREMLARDRRAATASASRRRARRFSRPWRSSASSSRCCSRPGSPPARDDGTVVPRFRGAAPVSDPRSPRPRRRVRRSAARAGRAQVSQLAREPDLPQGPPALQPAPGQGRHPEGGDGHPGRGLLRRAPAGARRDRARRRAARDGAHRRTRRRCSGGSRPPPILLYDSDQAGLRATFRAGDELLRHGVRVRVATMPPGEDPDTLVRAGGAAALEPMLRRRDRPARAQDPAAGADGVVRGRGPPARRARPAAPDDPGRGRSDHARVCIFQRRRERTGVSREVLLQQERGEPGSGDGPAPRRASRRSEAGAGTAGRPTARPRGGARVRSRCSRARALRVLMKDRCGSSAPPRRSRRTGSRRRRFREVYEALLRSPENVGSQIFLEELSRPREAAWALAGQLRAQVRDAGSGSDVRGRPARARSAAASPPAQLLDRGAAARSSR